MLHPLFRVQLFRVQLFRVHLFRVHLFVFILHLLTFQTPIFYCLFSAPLNKTYSSKLHLRFNVPRFI